MNAALFRRFAGGSPAFCAVWRGQTERETPFLNLKGQPALLIIVGLAAALRVLCRKCCQPLFEIGVVGVDMDKGVFLVKPNISGLFLLRKPCSHKLSFLPSVAQEWHFSAVFSGS